MEGRAQGTELGAAAAVHQSCAVRTGALQVLRAWVQGQSLRVGQVVRSASLRRDCSQDPRLPPPPNGKDHPLPLPPKTRDAWRLMATASRPRRLPAGRGMRVVPPTLVPVGKQEIASTQQEHRVQGGMPVLCTATPSSLPLCLPATLAPLCHLPCLPVHTFARRQTSASLSPTPRSITASWLCTTAAPAAASNSRSYHAHRGEQGRYRL